MLGLVLTFLQTWWKAIGIVVLVLLALGYVKYLNYRIDSLKEEVVELRTVISAANHKNQQLEEAAAVLSKKYERRLDNLQLEEDKKLKTVTERILKNESAKRIALERELVELFNASKPDGQPASSAKQGNDGKTSTPQTTLSDLLLVSAENDANHLKCINQVGEWQSFWKDYEAQVQIIGTKQ